MEQNFVFQVTAPDVDALLPEVSSALEQWMELASRRKNPKLWALTDRINRWNKAPTARTKRRRQGQVQGLVNWIVAMVVLPIAFLTPDSPLLVAVGALCLGIGVVELWRYLEHIFIRTIKKKVIGKAAIALGISLPAIANFVSYAADPAGKIAEFFDSRDKKPNNGYLDVIW